MIQRDYLMRYFEELGKVISYLLDLKKQKQYDRGLEVITKTWRGMLKVPENLLEDESLEELESLLGTEKWSDEELKIMAELLFQKGELFLDAHKEEQAVLPMRKALCIFQYLEKVESTYSLERVQKITYIKNHIEQINS